MSPWPGHYLLWSLVCVQHSCLKSKSLRVVCKGAQKMAPGGDVVPLGVRAAEQDAINNSCRVKGAIGAGCNFT